MHNSISKGSCVQSVFANLALTNKDTFLPKGFWKAFKDYDGQELNIREHQDGYEFFTRLQVPSNLNFMLIS